MPNSLLLCNCTLCRDFDFRVVAKVHDIFMEVFVKVALLE